MTIGKKALCAALALGCCGWTLADAVTGMAPFTEQPGVMEFSGQMIARPVQFETLVEQGLSKVEAAFRVTQAKAALAAYQLVWYEPLVDHYVIEVPEGETENSVSYALMGTGNFEYVTVAWICYPAVNPNDTRWGSMWHHAANRMNCAAGWDLHTGTPAVTVGICDTGCFTGHEDLLLNKKEGYNAVDRQWENQGGNTSDIHGHGTHTTGTATANGNNGKGVVGVGWNLSHRILKISNSSGGGSSLPVMQHAAIVAATAGDKAVSLSYTGVQDASNRAVGTQVKQLGSLWIWAAGNSGANLNWGDRDADDLIVVGATDENDNKAGFSNYGRSVDLTAPGNNILSTLNTGGYGNMSGTSMACPNTSGLAALIWSYNPTLTPDQVEDLLKAGCIDRGAQGVDDTYGYGRIEVYKTLQLVPHGKKGDLNCDDIVNFADINPFVLALSDPNEYKRQFPNCDIANGDCNNDGKVDFGDINPFVELIGS